MKLHSMGLLHLLSIPQAWFCSCARWWRCAACSVSLPRPRMGPMALQWKQSPSRWTTREFPNPGMLWGSPSCYQFPVPFYSWQLTGILDCFQFGATMNRAAMNIQEQVSGQTFIFISTNPCKYRHLTKELLHCRASVYLSLQEAIEPSS